MLIQRDIFWLIMANSKIGISIGSRLILAAVVFIAGASSVFAGERPNLDWIKYDPEILNAYSIDLDAGDTAINKAEPKWAKGTNKAATKLVMLIIPKRSAVAYSIGVNTILRTFHSRGIPARFVIWYYNRDEVVAREGLDWAYAQPVDLIMSVGSVATDYLHKAHRGHTIPAVTSASKDPVSFGMLKDYKSGSGSNIAYTSINVSTETLIAYLKTLVPDLKLIGTMYSLDNKSAILTQVKPLKAIAGEHGLEVLDITVRGPKTADEDLQTSMTKAMAAIKKRDPDGTRSLLLVTGSTPVYERVAQINANSGKLPVVSLLPDIVREGDESAVLSIGVNLTSAVLLASVYAIDIVTGKAEPGTLPVGTVSPPDLAISFRKARQIGLRIPFSFFESATFVYDPKGRQVIAFGQRSD